LPVDLLDIIQPMSVLIDAPLQSFSTLHCVTAWLPIRGSLTVPKPL
jgi:hypothetical protein